MKRTKGQRRLDVTGAYSFQLSNPPVLCMASLLVSLRYAFFMSASCVGLRFLTALRCHYGRLFDEAGGMSTLVAKSRALTGINLAFRGSWKPKLKLRLGAHFCTYGTGYLEMMLSETKLTPGRVTILTPADPRWRGCQLSLRFDCAVDAVEHAMRKCV